MKLSDQHIIPWVVDIVLKHRMRVYAVCLCISLIAAWICSHAVIASSVGKMFFGESPRYQRYLEINHQISSDIQVLVGFEGLDPLSVSDMQRFEELMSEIEEITVANYTAKDSSTDTQSTENNDTHINSNSPDLEGVDDFEDYDDADASNIQDDHIGVIKSVHGLPRANEIKREDASIKAHTYFDLLTMGQNYAQNALNRFADDPLPRQHRRTSASV